MSRFVKVSSLLTHFTAKIVTFQQFSHDKLSLGKATQLGPVSPGSDSLLFLPKLARLGFSSTFKLQPGMAITIPARSLTGKFIRHSFCDLTANLLIGPAYCLTRLDSDTTDVFRRPQAIIVCMALLPVLFNESQSMPPHGPQSMPFNGAYKRRPPRVSKERHYQITFVYKR